GGAFQIQGNNCRLRAAGRFNLVVDGFQLGNGSSQQDHSGTMTGEGFCCATANAIARPGYQDNTVFQEISWGVVVKHALPHGDNSWRTLFGLSYGVDSGRLGPALRMQADQLLLEPVKQLIRMVNDQVGGPGQRLVWRTEIAITGGDSMHTRGPTRLNVAHMIAHINRPGRLALNGRAGEPHGFRVRFTMGDVIRAYQDAAALLQIQLLQQDLTEPAGFVGHNSPGYIILI